VAVKPAPFDYASPATVAEAVSLLAAAPDAQVLAGGQSLVPLLALRRARPALLVDVNDLPLDEVEPDLAGGSASMRLGALVRHAEVERNPALRRLAPLLAEAAAWVGHPAIRHRGTIGGSLAFADPAAELPAAVVALGGEVLVQGPGGGRVVPAAAFGAGPYATVVGAGELVVAVRVPVAGPAHGDGHGAAFCEWAPRHNDRATAGVALAVDLDAGGSCHAVRAAACGVALPGPLALTDALTAVAAGEATVTDGLLRMTASVTTSAVASATIGGPGGPGGADGAELSGLLAARALRLAFERARAAPRVAA
jgi:carbon-monoxide dehydrogenase medium subunit